MVRGMVRGMGRLGRWGGGKGVPHLDPKDRGAIQNHTGRSPRRVGVSPVALPLPGSRQRRLVGRDGGVPLVLVEIKCRAEVQFLRGAGVLSPAGLQGALESLSEGPGAEYIKKEF